MGLIIAGERSGVGKTTVTLALLAALRDRAESVQAFKVGPDYIDPMFHQLLTGRPAYNLDPVLTSETYVQQCYARHGQTARCALIEGVMGLFDGAGGTDWASTAHIARLLQLPVLLVVDCSSLSRSLAAIVHGYQTLDPTVTLAGVVLNRVGSDRHATMLRAALADRGVPVLGVLRRDQAVALPDRHLGLVPAEELADLNERFRRLAALGDRGFDWEKLLPLLQVSPQLQRQGLPPRALPAATGPVRLGIARDRAFNFYYADNLELLTTLGAELVPWSPLTDTSLPPKLDGLYLGGGFPEMFAAELSQNHPLLAVLRQQIAAGLPVYAECGGLMYLCQALVDFNGQPWPLVAALPATTTMTGRLSLGYRHVTALQASPVVQRHQTFWGHEFHRSQLDIAPPAPLYQLQRYPVPGLSAAQPSTEGWRQGNIHASYIHFHWGTQPELPAQFLRTCRDRPRQSTQARKRIPGS